MGTAGLDVAVRKGAPLLEIVVRLQPDIDYQAATETLNSMAGDFHLTPQPWYDDPALRIGAATNEALERLFGWRFVRVPIPGSPKFFMWQESAPLRFVPDVARPLIKTVTVEQPGADDNGQWYE
jgi:hypothetical protein